MQEASRTFYKKNIFLKSYGTIPIDLGMKHEKFKLKRMSI